MPIALSDFLSHIFIGQSVSSGSGCHPACISLSAIPLINTFHPIIPMNGETDSQPRSVHILHTCPLVDPLGPCQLYGFAIIISYHPFPICITCNYAAQLHKLLPLICISPSTAAAVDGRCASDEMLHINNTPVQCLSHSIKS